MKNDRLAHLIFHKEDWTKLPSWFKSCSPVLRGVLPQYFEYSEFIVRFKNVCPSDVDLFILVLLFRILENFSCLLYQMHSHSLKFSLDY